MDISECSLIGMGDRLGDKSFRRLSASLYSVDTQ